MQALKRPITYAPYYVCVKKSVTPTWCLIRCEHSAHAHIARAVFNYIYKTYTKHRLRANIYPT